MTNFEREKNEIKERVDNGERLACAIYNVRFGDCDCDGLYCVDCNKAGLEWLIAEYEGPKESNTKESTRKPIKIRCSFDDGDNLTKMWNERIANELEINEEPKEVIEMSRIDKFNKIQELVDIGYNFDCAVDTARVGYKQDCVGRSCIQCRSQNITWLSLLYLDLEEELEKLKEEKSTEKKKDTTWHYLELNPKDLPLKSNYYIVSFSYIDINNNKQYDLRFTHTGTAFYNTGLKCWQFEGVSLHSGEAIEVLKWKELEE